MEVREAFAVELRAPEARDEPVEHARGHEAVPAEGAGMHVPDDPVGVVAERVDGLDREQRAFERRHAVERHRRGHELHHGVRAELVPGAAQGEQAVEHPAPGGRPEHQREDHAEALEPAGKGGVEQVVRAGPDIKEDQRPEVDDREAVAVDRSSHGLGDEVIHDAEDRRGQEERHGVMPVPPLHQGVLDAAEDRIAVQQARRQGEVVDDIEERDGDDRADVEPDGDVEAAFPPAGQRGEEDDAEDDPDEGDEHVDRPDELGVFLAAGVAEGQGDGGEDDDQLPAPEVDLGQEVIGEPRLQQALAGVVDAGEHHVPHEREDGRVGVQRAEPPEGGVGQAEVERGEGQLQGDDDADQQADDAPEDRGEGEPPDDLIVVADGDRAVVHGSSESAGVRASSSSGRSESRSWPSSPRLR